MFGTSKIFMIATPNAHTETELWLCSLKSI